MQIRDHSPRWAPCSEGRLCCRTAEDEQEALILPEDSSFAIQSDPELHLEPGPLELCDGASSQEIVSASLLADSGLRGPEHLGFSTLPLVTFSSSPCTPAPSSHIPAFPPAFLHLPCSQSWPWGCRRRRGEGPIAISSPP